MHTSNQYYNIVPLLAVSRWNDLSKSHLKQEVCDLIGETKNQRLLLCSCLDASTKLLVGLMANFLYAFVRYQPNIIDIIYCVTWIGNVIVPTWSHPFYGRG